MDNNQVNNNINQVNNNQVINNQVNNNQSNNTTQANNERSGRGLFYGIIAIAVFIIMAVGATYAYFTATTSSLNNSIRTGSTTLQLQFISYNEAWMNRDLIPADTAIVEYSFEGQNDTTETSSETMANTLCKDDYGNSICSVYVFQVTNDAASPQSVALEIASTTNTFGSLNAMAYELSLPTPANDYETITGEGNKNGSHDPIFRQSVDDETAGAVSVSRTSGNNASTTIPRSEYNPIYVNRKGVTKTLLSYIESRDETTGATVIKPSINRKLVEITEANFESDVDSRKVRVADNITIDSRTTKTFAIVLYIKNENIDQTDTDSAKEFAGQVIVSSGDGSTGVSGVISAATGQTLQSGESTTTTEPTEP